MNSLREKVEDLNRMIQQGQLLDAFEKYYADDVVMTEIGQEPRRGKATNRAYEEAFVGGLTAFRKGDVKAMSVDEESGVAFTEWSLDFTHKDWGDMAYDQVAVQRWRDGQVVEETFYHA